MSKSALKSENSEPSQETGVDDLLSEPAENGVSTAHADSPLGQDVSLNESNDPSKTVGETILQETEPETDADTETLSEPAAENEKTTNEADAFSKFDISDLAPLPDNLTGLIDPNQPSSSALIHESDLNIARNLRRLEVHRYEIAAALESLKEQELGDLIEEEEEEIELAESEQHYIQHLEEVRQKRTKKRLDPDQLLDETVTRLRDGLSRRAKNLVGNKDLKDLEFMGHNFCHTWHRLRYDQPIEQRLFRPETECPPRHQEIPAENEPPHENHDTDEQQRLQESTSELPGEIPSEIPHLWGNTEADTPAASNTQDQEEETPDTIATGKALEQQSETDAVNTPLCAPVRLVNWSLDQLANYQENKSFRHCAFLDPAAGHGRTLLIAAERDFRAIWGLEDQPELAEAAILNLRQYPRSYMTQRNIELFKNQPNISQWAEHPLLVHIFKPRSEIWLTNLLEALNASFYENQRQIYLVTIGNNFPAPLEEAAFLQPFTPTISNFEKFSLMSPYTIEFYHSVIPT